MIYKGRCFRSILTLLLALFPWASHAERRPVVITESSSSGQLVRITIGARNGIVLGEAVLFSSAGNKIAAGRAIRVEDNSAVVAILEKYGAESPSLENEYELLYGEPFAEADNLPDFVVDREDERDNPQNEKFWTAGEKEFSPDLDDENYTPELVIRPKFPLPRTFSPHNITVGLGIFRNRALTAANSDDAGATEPSGYSTYNGYAIRYAYTFRTHYWLKTQTPALISAEIGFGLYNFSHTFPSSIRPNPNEEIAQVRVIPIHVGVRYLIEVSKLFRLYPYLGYQHNIVSAVNGSLSGLEPLRGGRILGGAGAVLVMSDTIDTRVEAGTDGVLAGLVVKF